MNSTMNASPTRDPDIRYLLSIGLQFCKRFPWNQDSIGIPIYRYNYQACQYYGGTVTNFPTSQYPETIEWVNLSQIKNLVYNRTIEKKWPLKLYPAGEEGRFSTQSRCNDINIGNYYLPPDNHNNNLSSSLESIDTTETDYASVKNPNQ